MAFMELAAKIGLDASSFSAGINKAKSSVASLRSSIGSSVGSQVGGMLGVAAIVAYAKSTVDLGGKISDTSARLGISAEELQRWTFAATQTGSSAEDITSFFEKLAVAKAKALAGDKAAIASFKALGVSMDNLKKKKVADLAVQVGKTMQTGNVEELLPSLMSVGGKSAGALIPAFKSDFENVMASAPVMSNEAVASLDEVGDALDKMALQLRGPMADALKNIIPLFQTVIDGFNGISALMKDAVGGASAEGFGKIFKEFGSALIHFRLPKVAAEFDKMSSGGTKNFEAFGKSIRDREIAAADAALLAGNKPQTNKTSQLNSEIEKVRASAREKSLAAFVQLQNFNVISYAHIAEQLEVGTALINKSMSLDGVDYEKNQKLIKDNFKTVDEMQKSSQKRFNLLLSSFDNIYPNAEKEIAGLRNAAEYPEKLRLKPAEISTPASLTLRDSLSKIGGFTMAQNREVLDVQKEQVSLLEKIVDNTDKIEAPASVDDGLD